MASSTRYSRSAVTRGRARPNSQRRRRSERVAAAATSPGLVAVPAGDARASRGLAADGARDGRGLAADTARPTPVVLAQAAQRVCTALFAHRQPGTPLAPLSACRRGGERSPTVAPRPSSLHTDWRQCLWRRSVFADSSDSSAIPPIPPGVVQTVNCVLQPTQIQRVIRAPMLCLARPHRAIRTWRPRVRSDYLKCAPGAIMRTFDE
jgi:hypothetical protein